MSTIGFVGLGNMGYPMAHLLAEAGHTMLVQDVAAPAVERFLAEHRTASAAVGDWSSVDILVTMLPNSDIVETVVLSGLVPETLSPGTLVVDMSSSEPIRSRAVGAALAARGLHYIDAPVSGGVRGAVAGQLAIMVGGADEDVARAADVLAILAKSVIHAGAVGNGHAAKALNNLVSAASVLATTEALRIGEAFGLDPATLVDVLNASSGRSNTSENKAKQFMLSGSYASGFPIGLMTKDVRIALGLAHQLGVPAGFSEDTVSLWEAACKQGHAAEDHTRMYEVLPQVHTVHAAGK